MVNIKMRGFFLFFSNFIPFVINLVWRVYKVVVTWVSYGFTLSIGAKARSYMDQVLTWGESDYLWDHTYSLVYEISVFGWDEVFEDWDFQEDESMFSDEFELDDGDDQPWLEEDDEKMLNWISVFDDNSSLEEPIRYSYMRQELHFKYPGTTLLGSFIHNLEFPKVSKVKSLFFLVKYKFFGLFYKIKNFLKWNR
jgi:hypothetical protein